MVIIFIGGRPISNLTHMKKYTAIKMKGGDVSHRSRKNINPTYDPYTHIGSLGREMYCVINDGGYEMLYPKKCFMTEEEFRDKKLNQILE